MEINFGWLFIACLATWRITNIINNEKIFEPLRKGLGDDGIHIPASFFGYLVACFYCLSVWVGLVCALLYYFYPFVLLPFFMSAVAIILRNMNRESNE